MHYCQNILPHVKLQELNYLWTNNKRGGIGISQHRTGTFGGRERGKTLILGLSFLASDFVWEVNASGNLD